MPFHGQGRRDFTGSENPLCGKNTLSLQTLHLGFLRLFPSYWFFLTRDQNAAVGWWLWEGAPSFFGGFHQLRHA